MDESRVIRLSWGEWQSGRVAKRAALAALGPVLGRCGVQRQCAEIALARRRLSESADAAEREIAERARRFPILGAALGAIAAVVLL